MRYVQAIALVLTVFISVLVQANAVSAHWDLDSRFWRENPEAIKPDEWKTHGFELKDLVVYEEAKQAGKLLTGRYRAVAVAREQRNRWVKIFLGAALLRHYSDFVVK
jgi:type II secretory pathway component PulL